MAARSGTARPAFRSVRPTWWWFMLCGLLAVAFGIVTLATRCTDERAFLLNAGALSLLSLACGVLAVCQAVSSRRYVRGWGVLLAVGIHAITASVVFAVLAVAALPHALLWSIVSFLMVQGAMIAFGFLRSPAYRMWGLLAGPCMFAAAVILTIAWVADPAHSFEIPDAGLGIASLLFGCAVFVAALDARAARYRDA